MKRSRPKKRDIIDITLFCSAVICFIQEISRVFSFGVISVSSSFFSLINEICVAWLCSYCFYILVEFLPRKRSQKNYVLITGRFLTYIITNLNTIRIAVADSLLLSSFTVEKLNQYISRSENFEGYQFFINHADSMVEKLLAYHSILDSETVALLSELQLHLFSSKLSENVIFENTTQGEVVFDHLVNVYRIIDTLQVKESQSLNYVTDKYFQRIPENKDTP